MMPPSPAQDPPCYLGIDSATHYLALALWSAERGTLASFCEPVERDHARRIMPQLSDLCHRAGISRRALAGIGVGVGPGSYTGLRVGIAAARALARALDVPLMGVSTLEAIAANHLSEAQPGVLVTLDARRGKVYAAAFAYRQGAPVPQGDARKLPRDALTRYYGTLPCVEAQPPRGSYLARRAAQGEHRDPVAIYL